MFSFLIIFRIIILSQFPKANVLHCKNNIILTLGRISLGLYPCGFVIRPCNVTSFPPVTSTPHPPPYCFPRIFRFLLCLHAGQDVTLNFVRARSLSTILGWRRRPRRHEARGEKGRRVSSRGWPGSTSF